MISRKESINVSNEDENDDNDQKQSFNDGSFNIENGNEGKMEMGL